MTHLLLIAVAFVAFAVSTISGGGAGLALMPLLKLVVPANQVPAALSIGTALSSLSRAAIFRRDIEWRIVVWFVPAAVPFTIAGAWLLSIAQPVWVELLLGLFLVANIVTLLRRKTVPAERVACPPTRLVVVGACAGALSGFTGAVGVVFNDFYLRCGLSKEQLVATRAANEILLHVLKIGLYARFGLLGADAVQAGLLLACAAILSAMAARPLLGLVSETLFRKVNHAAMCVAGGAMVITSSYALARKHDIDVGGKVGRGSLEAKLHIGSDAYSLGWKTGRGPEFERTIAASTLPRSIRQRLPDRMMGARYAIVHDLTGISYEVTDGGVTRHMVVTD